jgi:hypothetical protein
VIPGLFDQVRNLGVTPLVARIVFVVLLTAAVFLIQSVAQWFADRDS